METELIKELNSILKAFPQFWDGEKLHRSMVIEAINQKEPKLIKALINNDKIKSLYSTDIDGILIFDFDKLTSLLKYKEYWADSFTKYRNKVGLTSEGKYLEYNTDVVLDFPFKDCVLEGGMTKEEQGKDEIYYNEVIARDEIDRLFAPKVFTNAKRYTKDGIEEKITDFSDEDNLIIKGNNLIALHSLKDRYAGKVKLIYIDPPYNTGNDSFKYNDRFNRSTWLTFMKNRLEVARDLLSDDGSIWINIDENESFYLKVLSDSIFNEDNFIGNVIWNHTKQSKNDERFFSRHYNQLIIYAKNKSLIPNFISARTEQDNKAYKNPDQDPKGAWRSGDVRSPNLRESLKYDVIAPDDSIISAPENGWRWSKDTLNEKIKTGEVIFKPDNSGIIRKIYLSEQEGRTPENLWYAEHTGTTRDANSEIKALFGYSIFSTPKPESLLQRIIHLSSKENDLVLDFHLGSGTTSAVAHKMGRRYIGIEQMDYINEITVPRLQKVIDGEQGGISKDIEWKGGGSFVYAELMELNYLFIHEIEKAENYQDLEKLFDVMKSEAHLNYQIALDKVLKAEYEVDGIPRMMAFNELDLHEQKRLLIEILDKNQLYVNASEMEDSQLNVSEHDQAFTKSFYSKNEE